MLIKANSKYLSFEMNDPSHPFSKMQGECFGSFEIRAPNATGSGNCVFRDAEGNISANRFDVTGMTAKGALTGTWSVVGSTGPYAHAAGGGHFIR